MWRTYNVKLLPSVRNAISMSRRQNPDLGLDFQNQYLTLAFFILQILVKYRDFIIVSQTTTFFFKLKISYLHKSLENIIIPVSNSYFELVNTPKKKNQEFSHSAHSSGSPYHCDTLKMTATIYKNCRNFPENVYKTSFPLFCSSWQCCSFYL